MVLVLSSAQSGTSSDDHLDRFMLTITACPSPGLWRA